MAKNTATIVLTGKTNVPCMFQSGQLKSAQCRVAKAANLKRNCTHATDAMFVTYTRSVKTSTGQVHRTNLVIIVTVARPKQSDPTDNNRVQYRYRVTKEIKTI